MLCPHSLWPVVRIGQSEVSALVWHLLNTSGESVAATVSCKYGCFSIGVALWTLSYMMVRRQYSNLHQHLCVIILVAGNEQQKWLWWCFCCALSLSATTNLAPLNFLEHELDLFLRELKHLFYISRLLLDHQKPNTLICINTSYFK
jgi:hypothetical protein